MTPVAQKLVCIWSTDLTGYCARVPLRTDARARAEAWFLEHGLPYFVDDLRADVRRRLYLEVKRFADCGSGATTPGTGEMTPEQEEKLRSLGYIN